ncbi:MAG: ABC transporter ATP-binding protein [Eubacteriales bacterium]|nr:ABC transporter ATP-binding protein [Eubacteriales bacterium]
MEYALSIENLEKNYGDFKALKKINFKVKPNEIFALIGPNGAGKTTTLRIISTILNPDSGDVFLYGTSIRQNPEKVRGIISYLPEEAGAYKNMTGIGYLKFMGSLFSNDPGVREEFIETAKEVSGLDKRLNDKISTYSKGMVRKLLLSRAIMTKPKLAILDEPTSGLDVINALEIRNTIKEFAKKGMTVLVSSHNMLEIEYLCDRVAMINKGEILKVGSPAELKTEMNCANLEEVFSEVVK